MGHQELVRYHILKNFQKILLFCHSVSLGKTSTILACAKQLYSPTEFNAMVLELNASDDRGIGIVRDQIMSFASTKTIFKYII